MKKSQRLGSMGIIWTMLLSAAFLTLPAEMEASQVVAIEGMSFDVWATLKDNLKSFTGKDMYVTLRSGKTYQGFLKSVGDHFIHLEKIAGKDFFDALLRMEDISAIELKFRDIKRQ